MENYLPKWGLQIHIKTLLERMHMYMYRSCKDLLNCVVNKDHRPFGIYLCRLYLRLFRTSFLYLWGSFILRTHRRVNPNQLIIKVPQFSHSLSLLSVSSQIMYQPACAYIYLPIVLTLLSSSIHNYFNKFNLYYFDNRCVFPWLILIPKRGSFDPNLRRFYRKTN